MKARWYCAAPLVLMLAGTSVLGQTKLPAQPDFVADLVISLESETRHSRIAKRGRVFRLDQQLPRSLVIFFEGVEKTTVIEPGGGIEVIDGPTLLLESAPWVALEYFVGQPGITLNQEGTATVAGVHCLRLTVQESNERTVLYSAPSLKGLVIKIELFRGKDAVRVASWELRNVRLVSPHFKVPMSR